MFFKKNAVSGTPNPVKDPSPSDGAAPRPNPDGSDAAVPVRDPVVLVTSRNTGSTLETQTDTDPSGGLAQIVRSPNVFFDAECGRLEREAKDEAQHLAAVDQPARDIAKYEEHPAESRLRARCANVFVSWGFLVEKLGMDTVNSVALAVRESMAEYRSHWRRLQRLRREAADLKEDLDAVTNGGQHVQTGVAWGYERHLQHWQYLLLATVLVGVDAVANLPIFYELQSVDPSTERSLRDLYVNAEDMGLYGGLYRLLAESMMLPLATLMAIGVIAVLFVACDFFGRSLRDIKAHAPEELTAKARVHARPFPLAAKLSGVAVVVVLAGIYFCRYLVGPLATQRAEGARAQVTELSQQLAAATKRSEPYVVSLLNQKLVGARGILEQREEQAAYSEHITSLNNEILAFNIGLVLIAVLGAYFSASVKTAEDDTYSPDYLRIVAELETRRKEVAAELDALGVQYATIVRGLPKVAQLASADPWGDWRGRKARLEAVIDLFRETNGKHRHIDPRLIPAFSRPSVLEIQNPHDNHQLAAPAAFWDDCAGFRAFLKKADEAEYEEFGELLHAIGLTTVTTAQTPASGTPAPSKSASLESVAAAQPAMKNGAASSFVAPAVVLENGRTSETKAS